MDFAEWIREQATKTYTENGAAARNTTGDARLDLFATIGSLRRADPERIELLFGKNGIGAKLMIGSLKVVGKVQCTRGTNKIKKK